MQLELVANIFKIYKAEKRIHNSKHSKQPYSTPSPVVRSKKRLQPPSLKKKNLMHYHMFNPNIPEMTPEQRFQHAITVRNRTFGPDKGTTVSPHLDVEITPNNRSFLKLTPDDVNMYRVLQVCLHLLFLIQLKIEV
jgi:hypothetical protein